MESDPFAYVLLCVLQPQNVVETQDDSMLPSRRVIKRLHMPNFSLHIFKRQNSAIARLLRIVECHEWL